MKKLIKAFETPSESICENVTLRGVRDTVEKLIATYGEDAEWHLDCGYCNISEQISYTREETDKEYRQRLKDEERARTIKEKVESKREEQELKEYKRLHKKYGEKK